jgi:acyl transferase domain-containing protein
VSAFWWNLCAGVDSIHDYTDDELAALGIGTALRGDPEHVRAGGRLDGIEDFDAEFFGFTADEAARTDPQHRLFLEAAWQALEDAGRDPATEQGPVGIFASSSANRYFLFHLFDNPAVTGAVDTDDWETRLLGRQLTDHLPGQLAYRLGLTGPALAVQSACSSSLAAVCLAAQSLAEYRCDLALAGGVSVTWPRYRSGALASADGRCRAFDAAANGSGFSSGVGVVALRRLADAIADRDHIYAVLPGWAMTNDGPNRAGYAVPGPAGQAAALAEALAVAQVDPAEVRLIEAHGSGTPLGDAIEVSALNRVYRGSAPAVRCALGSVKTNIGHLDAAERYAARRRDRGVRAQPGVPGQRARRALRARLGQDQHRSPGRGRRGGRPDQDGTRGAARGHPAQPALHDTTPGGRPGQRTVLRADQGRRLAGR